MALDTIHSFLVHPAKALDDQPEIGGTAIQKSGRLFQMLSEIYDKSKQECQFEIAFLSNDKGEQRNECRDLLIDYVKAQTIAEGRTIAERLQKVTTNRSGLGLFFLMAGKEGDRHKLVLSRFPADQGILAEEDRKTLSVEFVEKVFMKSATAYKAAVFEGKSLSSDFWIGHAVDRQINSNVIVISNYWIKEFLASDFRTQGAEGTRRLAIALKDALSQASNISQKEEIVSVVKLIPALQGKVVCAKEVMERFSLTDPARETVKKQFKGDALFEERFRFVAKEFSTHIAFRSMELDNGGVLTASTDKFDQIFTQKTIDSNKKRVEITTQGVIVNQRLRKAKT